MNKLIVFKSTGEVRPPKAGEWFVSTMFDGEIHFAHKDFPDIAHKQVLTRYEIEATPDVLAILKLEASK